MAHFFSLLRYSFGNEDWKTEQEALNIQPQDVVLCITASGDRPLNLLNRPCQKLVSLDANRVQNFLLELKVAAMKVLDYPQYVAFLGAAPASNRREVFKTLLPYLSQAAGEFWLRHGKMIEKGIVYQGGVEKLTRVVAAVFSMTRGKKVKKLFSMDDLEEQKRFVREEWNSVVFRNILRIALNPLVSRFIIKDPGLVNFDSGFNAGSYIYDRINASLQRDLAKKNLLLSLLVKGKVAPDAFSPHLTEKGSAVIKQRLSCLEIRTEEIMSYLKSIDQPTFDAFSLSDIASYMSYSKFVELLTLVIKTAKPGARFCFRQFLSSYDIPDHLKPYFSRDKELEKKLEASDNCFVYRFMVGIVNYRGAMHAGESLRVELTSGLTR